MRPADRPPASDRVPRPTQTGSGVAGGPGAGPADAARDAQAPAPLARWVTALDVLAVTLLVVAFIAAVGGDLRYRLGALRLTISEPFRPLLVAVVIIAVRHALIREQPLPTRFVGLWRRLSAVDGWAQVWRPFVVTRAAVLLIGLLAVYTVRYPPEAPPFRLSTSEVVNLPVRWDAGWYVGIATHGYRWDARRADRQQNIAFFPAYPVVVGVTAMLFGGSLTADLLAGVVVSHVAFLWALIALYQLTREQLGDPSAAAGAVVLLATYPFSVFHGAIYTESLFLLGCVSAILNFRRERLLQAAGWGVLVGLTRPNGFVLSLTLAAFAWSSWSTMRSTRTRSRAWVLPALAIAAPVVGALLYSAYVAMLTGNPLQWSAQHAAWGRVYKGVSALLEPAIEVGEHGVARHPYEILNAVAAAFVLILVVPVWRQLGLPYAVFLVSNLIPPLFIGGVMSIGRLTSTLFPLFMYVGAAARRDTIPSWAAGFAAGQALVAVLFYTWRPLY